MVIVKFCQATSCQVTLGQRMFCQVQNFSFFSWQILQLSLEKFRNFLEKKSTNSFILPLWAGWSGCERALEEKMLLLITATSITPMTEASWIAWTTGGMQIDHVRLRFWQNSLQGTSLAKNYRLQPLKLLQQVAKKGEKRFVKQHALVDGSTNQNALKDINTRPKKGSQSSP